MRKTSSRLLPVLLLALLAAGCHKPSETYALVSRHTAAADGGRYTFELDLEDTACTYATGIAARLNTARLPQSGLELQLHVVAPDGTSAIERVTFPLSANAAQYSSNRNEGAVRDYNWPWREGIRVDGLSAGRWRVVISLPDTTLARAVEGIGLTCKEIWEKEN